jgi:ribose transport system permease protein
MSGLGAFLRDRRETGFAAALLVLLLVVNILLNPARFAPAAWGTLIGLAAPLVMAAIASTPAILSGRGGIDVSVGPQMAFVNGLIVQVLVTNLGVTDPVTIVLAAIVAGAAMGAINGVFVTVLRIQPIVATLGSYLILSGLTFVMVPAPMGTVPAWIKDLSGATSIVPFIVVGIAWLLLKRTPYYDQLMATGSDDRAAYTAGVAVGRVRFIAYVITGALAGLAGLSLTALIGSADPTIGTNYTLIAISSVALGGVSLAGGRGGLLGAAIGAIDIWLLQSALTYFNVSTFVLQIAYGAILVGAVSLNAVALKPRRGRAA